jgi:hypothetical protein
VSLEGVSSFYLRSHSRYSSSSFPWPGVVLRNSFTDDRVVPASVIKWRYFLRGRAFIVGSSGKKSAEMVDVGVIHLLHPLWIVQLWLRVYLQLLYALHLISRFLTSSAAVNAFPPSLVKLLTVRSQHRGLSISTLLQGVPSHVHAEAIFYIPSDVSRLNITLAIVAVLRPWQDNGIFTWNVISIRGSRGNTFGSYNGYFHRLLVDNRPGAAYLVGLLLLLTLHFFFDIDFCLENLLYGLVLEIPLQSCFKLFILLP